MTGNGRYPLRPLSSVVARFTAGVSVNAEDRAPGRAEHGVLKVSAVGHGRFDAEESKAVLHRELSRVGPSIRRGDVLVTRANTHDLVGAAAFVDRDYPMLHLSDKTWRAVLCEDNYDARRWLAHVLNMPTVRSQLRRRATGTSGSMKNIGQASYLAIVIPYAPAEARGPIADIVDAAASAAEQTRALIMAKRRFSLGLMHQLLTGQRRFQSFGAEPWSEASIGELFEEVTRPVEWDDRAVYDLLSIRRRSGGVFLRSRMPARDIATKSMFEAHEGDILISRMQAVHGAIGIAKKEHHGMKISGSYIALRPRADAPVVPDFFAWLTRLPRMYRAALLSSYGVHIEKMTFNLPWYLQTTVALPCVAEQRQIVALLDLCEREENLLSQLSVALDRQKAVLLDKLLSGEIQVSAT